MRLVFRSLLADLEPRTCIVRNMKSGLNGSIALLAEAAKFRQPESGIVQVSRIDEDAFLFVPDEDQEGSAFTMQSNKLVIARDIGQRLSRFPACLLGIFQLDTHIVHVHVLRSS